MIVQFNHLQLVLAQNGGPPLEGDGESTSDPGGSTGAPGGADGTGATGGGGAGSPFGSNFFFIMIAVLILIMFWSMRTQSKEKKKRASMLSTIKKHDRVQTVGGVIGAVVEIKPDTIVLKVDESSNTRITFDRGSVQRVLSGDGEKSN